MQATQPGNRLVRGRSGIVFETPEGVASGLVGNKTVVYADDEAEVAEPKSRSRSGKRAAKEASAAASAAASADAKAAAEAGDDGDSEDQEDDDEDGDSSGAEPEAPSETPSSRRRAAAESRSRRGAGHPGVTSGE